MIERNLTPAVLAALADTPVVALHGARQTGKSTLAQAIATTAHPARYYTLDDSDVLSAVRDDARAFLDGLDGPVVIDEIQRAPQLLLAVKAAVDRDRRPGRFLLTGSAQLMALPRRADTLAGRIEVLTLHPFTQGELAGVRERLVDRLFGDAALARAPASEIAPAQGRSQVIDRVVAGGFPEAVSRSSQSRRSAWFRAYVETATERTVRDVSEIAGLPDLRRLLAALAYRSGSTVSAADLSRTLAVPQTTLKRYLALLEIAFLVQRLPAWSANVTSRLVKTAKIYVSDSGLLAHLLGADARRLADEPMLFGQMLESFVVAEIDRQVGWADTPVRLFHFRTHGGREVDLVLEDDRGRVVGVEVKATASPSSADFAGLRALAEAAGKRFHRGVVVCMAADAIPFGPMLQTLPLAALWEIG
jgi:predicted AAA+ superfamily ATPase